MLITIKITLTLKIYIVKIPVQNSLHVISSFHKKELNACCIWSSYGPWYLLDFMSDLVHIDATVVGFLLIVTISTLRKVSPKKTL